MSEKALPTCRDCLAEQAYDLRDESRTFARRGLRFAIAAAIIGALLGLMFDQRTFLATQVVLYALYVLGPIALAASATFFALAGIRRWSSKRLERAGRSALSGAVPYRAEARCARHVENNP